MLGPSIWPFFLSFVLCCFFVLFLIVKTVLKLFTKKNHLINLIASLLTILLVWFLFYWIDSSWAFENSLPILLIIFGILYLISEFKTILNLIKISIRHTPK